MQKLDFYISGKLSPPPDNWQALTVELSFENESPEGVLNATLLIWKGENAGVMNQWFQGGLNGFGYGIFEGIPLTIKICDTQEVLFNGIIDLTDSETKFNCDIVKCRIRDKRMDMITQLFDSISFAYLATPVSDGGAGIINPTTIANGGDYFPIPYQRNNIPDGLETMIAFLSVYETIEMFQKTIKEIIALVDAAVGATAAIGLGAIVATIIELLAWISELIVMIFVLVRLITQLMHEMIGPIPSFKKLGMKVITACERACQYFGLQFSSSIFTGAYADLVFMPTKLAWEDNRKLSNIITTFFSQLNAPSYTRMNYDDEYNLSKGGSAYGFPDNTVGQFFRMLEDVFCAKMKIIFNSANQPVLHFERWNYQYKLSPYQLPNISDQAPFPQGFGTNASELASNYLIKWATDDSDLNTINTFEGTSCYAQLQPLSVSVLQNVVLKNLTEIEFAFSQGLVKTRLQITEHIFNALWNLMVAIPNAVIGAINTIINIINKVLKFLGAGSIPTIPALPTNPLSTRLGNLLLSNDITNQPKLMLCKSNGDLYANNHTSSDPLSAKVLFKNFHYSKLALTVDQSGNTYTNQYWTYDNQEIPMCCADYDAIKNNNYIRTFDGQIAKVTSIKWNVFHGKARIDYRINKPFTNNLQVSYMIDGAKSTKSL